MTTGLPPGGSYQPAPPLPDPIPQPAAPLQADPSQSLLLEQVLSQKSASGAPIIVDREKLNLATRVSSMEFIMKVIGDEPYRFLPSDIMQTSHQIKEIDQAPGKDYYQATIVRKICCKTEDGKEQEFILQEKINIGIKVPDPRMSDERTMTSAKMEALFAVDGYESRITRAICDRKTSDVVKPVFKIQLQRAPRAEGFYGDRSVRSIDAGLKPGIANIAKHTFTSHGSVKGSVVDGMTFTSQIFVPTDPRKPQGELSIIKRGKWTTFKNIPCPLEKRRSLAISSFTSPISDFLKGSPRWRDALAANEAETKLLFDEVKVKLVPKGNVHLSDVMSTTTRGLGDQIDALDDSIITDHTRIPPTTDEAIQMLSTLSKQLTQIQNSVKALKKGIDALELIKNRTPEQENHLQLQNAELTSLNNQLDDISEQREDFKELLIKRVQLHSYKMKVIQEKLDTLELLTTYCSEMVEPKNLEIHKENLQRLYKQVEKAELQKRLTNLKNIIIKNTVLTEADLTSPIPPRQAKKATPAPTPAAPGRPPVPIKPLPPIPGSVIAAGKHAPPRKPLPPIPEAGTVATPQPIAGPASLAGAAPIKEPAKDPLRDTESSVPISPETDRKEATFVGPAGEEGS